MDTLQLQHQMQSTLLMEITIASKAAALLTPEVAQHTAAIASALDGKVTVNSSKSGLDIYIDAANDTHPDALQIALQQNLPLIEYINSWQANDQYGHRSISLVRNGPVQFICRSDISSPDAEPV